VLSATMEVMYDKHAEMCTLQSFMTLGLKCLTHQYSTTSNRLVTHSFCAFTICAVHAVIA